MALTVTHSKTLVAPDSGVQDKVYGVDYVSPTSHTLSGVASLAQGGTGNATGTATVNANLTGPITSTGNATAVASQTGTGSKFVMDTAPSINDLRGVSR